MLKFLSYFFGKGESVEFANFTVVHFMPILIVVGMLFFNLPLS